MTSDEIKEIMRQLEEPFHPDLISWKPQITSYKDPENPKAKGAAYADQRAYTDRLNEVVGPHGWTRAYRIHSVQGVDKEVRAGAERKILTGQAKVFVVASVSIVGIGTHEATGESWVDDDNACTSAEAQAFKRACVCFGLGRYLYDLPETDWLPIDKYSKQFKTPPQLPEWASPKAPPAPEPPRCFDCGHDVVPATIQGKPYGVEDLLKRSQEHYRTDLCWNCQRERAKIGKKAAS